MVRQSKVAREDYRITGGMLFYGDEYLCEVGTQSFIRIADTKTTKAIRVQSLDEGDDTYVEWNGNEYAEYRTDAEFTIRQEIRGGKIVWYAYRRVAGKLHKRYVGYATDLTREKLWEVAVKKLPTNRSARVK